MNVLIINSGSSSVKFQLLEMPEEVKVASGIVERIGKQDAVFSAVASGVEFRREGAITSHRDGLKMITDYLLDPSNELLAQREDVEVVGHRVVHGGNTISGTCVIDQKVKRIIEEYSSMAPLHNPHNLSGILITEELFPEATQVAVFDTAYHQTIPVKAHKYAIPDQFYTEKELRVYGFHGTSHAFVVKQAMQVLPQNASKIISVHLGNGCSITAVRDGKSVDTSLGFGPSNGLIMGTRSGDIDHSLIFYMMDTLGYEATELKDLLDRESGMLGLTGYSDLREIESLAEKGEENAILALEMNAYRIKKYIGAYMAAMNGLDALIFTAGIGENSSRLRELICGDMEALGLSIDPEKNAERSTEIRRIDSGDKPVQILVVPTNEELEIAMQAYQLLKN